MEKESVDVEISNDNIIKKENEENSSIYRENNILEAYNIFLNAYESSDNLSFVDSEEDESSKNLENSKKKNILSLTVHNIINIYPNNERNREFKKYKQKTLEEKRKKEFEEEKKILEEKKKIYDEKRQKKLEIYNIKKKKKKLVEREKYNKENIDYNYLMVLNYFEFLMKNNKFQDIYFSFHDLYISPMRLYFFSNINVNDIYYLDLSRRWLSDNYISAVLDLCLQKNVKILNLSYNKITFNGLDRFITFFSKNKYLFSLNMEGNDLTNKGQNCENVNNFFDAIKNNKVMKIVNIANSNMNMNNGDALCTMLKMNKSIIKMNFENNNFTHDQNRKIIEYLARNKELRIKQVQIEKEENYKMEKEENYMRTYIMSLECSIIEIENKERRKNLNKMIYVNMWREQIKKKEKYEDEIHESLEKEHEKRTKLSQKKKKKKKKM
ncbi:conserved Plasmodium protein, unknown function [Plasmodium berghei]|uniref:Leucine-rich repeat protein n=2 Tax=Plasmodium berghei TaxID=5821 RepID=A0A509ALH2_PLABA|nr:conserved protein, unknown function [Plasmodium berghei ANKA]CXI57181.1 conserved Plasmodium protein, unknown function [Plasmodium berghei]SCL95505.1 conserved Plasmodium protein, unknown function [Plasmodium berghei]SCM16275.1 conserved Plasmodium protein, unknown function [Plasmodium berghei]SCM18071.1 conserved Plasmodium protein, unknown function [Plasmodium berghei]SCN26531.1 conserved Plasmodium protein, unknown function [Plasmodium berghei]|eukprot:XP_034422199.1 conserved protein, unknown function [Plasmodium berghei ANKA]